MWGSCGVFTYENSIILKTHGNGLEDGLYAPLSAKIKT